MMTSGQIREHFLDFFRSKQHTIVPSAPIVIKNDPTLLFTNAGMNQFKDYFLGNKEAPWKRVADTQKCLRVSGKHNDLEEVGVDTYHHTMFEMLGNWSFGNYFKEEAIEWSWELLTVVYGIPKDRLYVTVFEGDAKEKLPRDGEAIGFWKKWIDEDRIIMGNKKDNFWEMGDTGPCGPCTEIHVDCRTEDEKKLINGKDLVNNDHPQVIEIWNNVFIQYNRKKDGSLEQLPSQHVDTGMGFERLVRVLQNKQSNYDTDVFTGTIAEIEQITGKTYGAGDTKPDVAFRVIADHIRAIAFPIADGQLPSNTGAGYVIRRILRRAVRYYFSYLDSAQPLLHKLIPLLSKQFENVFPELTKQSDFITKVIHEEEQNFLRTLDAGLKRLDLLTSQTEGNAIDGRSAFELYDTFGFPIDLTRLIASEKNLAVDEKGFESEMKKQKDRSRSAAVVDTGDWIAVSDGDSSVFVGYDSLETESTVIKYRKAMSQGKEAFHFVLNKTPFYAESGGQVGDKGTIMFDGEEIEVYDTKKENDLIIHYTARLPAVVSAEVSPRVDRSKRSGTQLHHSATHLIHAALRAVLGTHVAQKGSLVNHEHLRFDFSHFAKVSDEDISKVQSIVNEKIRENIPVVIKQLPKDEAIAMGAMALFGEKYGDVVRVVIIDPGYSIELCGGTHVGSTGELGTFRIKSETAIGSGVRRIEAVSGRAADRWIDEQLYELNQVKQFYKNPKDVVKAVEAGIAEKDQLSRSLEKAESKQGVLIKDQLLNAVQEINDVQFIGEVVEVNNADTLKKICFLLKAELSEYIVVLAADIDGKAHVVIMLDENVSASKKLEAPKMIKEIVAPLIKGGGGGQKTLATAGGQDASKLKEVISKIKESL